MNKIAINGIKLAFQTFKNGRLITNINKHEKTLLVLHGGPGIVDHQIELSGWKQFSDICQVIFLDQRGCGQSEDGASEDWNLTQCGRDIKTFFDTLGIQERIVGGVSWGGYVAMSYASQFPDDPAGLILANTEAQVNLESKMQAYARAINALNIWHKEPFKHLGSNQSDIAHAIGQIACDYDQNPSEENFARFVDYCVPHFSKTEFALQPPFRVNMAMRQQFIGEESLNMDYLSSLNTVACPVLQLAGDRDPTHPAECAEITAHAFPNATFINIKDAGAPVYQDQPGIFDELVRDFIINLNPENTINYSI